MSVTPDETPTSSVVEEPRTDLTKYCRFRPFIKFEMSDDTDKKAQCSVAFHKSLKNVLLKYGVDKPVKFDFDKVFPMSTTPEQVFDSIGSPIIADILTGCSNLIVSCGAKYSGKSFSIVGSRNWDSEEICPNDALLYRCFKQIIDESKLGTTVRLLVIKVKQTGLVELSKSTTSVINNLKDLNDAMKNVIREDQQDASPGLVLYTFRMEGSISSNLTFVDVGLDEMIQLSDYLKGIRNEGNTILSTVLSQLLSDNFKVVVLANCSPHVSAAEFAKRTMELTSGCVLNKSQPSPALEVKQEQAESPKAQQPTLPNQITANNEEYDKLKIHYEALKTSLSVLTNECHTLKKSNIEMKQDVTEQIKKKSATLESFITSEINKIVEERNTIFDEYKSQLDDKKNQIEILKQNLQDAIEKENIIKIQLDQVLAQHQKEKANIATTEDEHQNLLQELTIKHANQIEGLQESLEVEKRQRVDIESVLNEKLKQTQNEKTSLEANLENLSDILKEKQILLEKALENEKHLEMEAKLLSEKLTIESSKKSNVDEHTQVLKEQILLLERTLQNAKSTEDDLLLKLKDSNQEALKAKEDLDSMKEVLKEDETKLLNSQKEKEKLEQKLVRTREELEKQVEEVRKQLVDNTHMFDQERDNYKAKISDLQSTFSLNHEQTETKLLSQLDEARVSKQTVQHEFDSYKEKTNLEIQDLARRLSETAEKAASIEIELKNKLNEKEEQLNRLVEMEKDLRNNLKERDNDIVSGKELISKFELKINELTKRIDEETISNQHIQREFDALKDSSTSKIQDLMNSMTQSNEQSSSVENDLKNQLSFLKQTLEEKEKIINNHLNTEILIRKDLEDKEDTLTKEKETIIKLSLEIQQMTNSIFEEQALKKAIQDDFDSFKHNINQEIQELTSSIRQNTDSSSSKEMELKQQINDMDNQIKNLLETESNLTQLITKKEAEIETLKTQYKEATNLVKESEERFTEISNKLDQIQSSLSERENELLNIKSEKDILDKLKDVMESDIQKLEQQLRDLNTIMTNTNQQMNDIVTESEELKSIIALRDKEISSLIQSKYDAETLLEKLKHDASSSNNTLLIEKNNLEEEKTRLVHEVEQALSVSKSLQTDLEITKEHLVSLGHKVDESKNENENLVKRNNELQESLEILSKSYQILKDDTSKQLAEKDTSIQLLEHKEIEITKKLVESDKERELKRNLEIEKESLVVKFDSLEKEIKTINQQLDTVSRERESTKIELENTLAIVYNLNNTVTNITEERDALSEKLKLQILNSSSHESSLDVIKEQYESEISKHIAQHNSQVSKVKQLVDDLRKSKENTEKEASKRSSLEKELFELQKLNKTLEKEAQEKRDSTDKTVKTLKDKESELKDIKREAIDLSKRVKSLEASAQEKDKEFIKLKKELEKKSIALLEKPKSQDSGATDLIKQLQQEKETLEIQVKELSENVHSPVLDNPTIEMAKLRNELELSNMEISNLRSKLNELSQEKQRNQIYADITTKPSKDKILSHIQTLIFAIEKAKQEKYHYKKTCRLLEQELELWKKAVPSLKQQKESVNKFTRCESIIKEMKSSLKQFRNIQE